MELEQYLKGRGFSNSGLNEIIESIHMRDAEIVDGRIQYLKNLLGLNDKEINIHIKKFPGVLGQSVYAMGKKFDKLQELTKLSFEEVVNMIKRQPQVLALSSSIIIKKMKFYQKFFKITEEKVVDMIKNLPALLAYDTDTENPTSVKTKVKFYKEYLGVGDKKISEIIQHTPNLLSLDVNSEKDTSIKTKFKYLNQFASKQEIIKNPNLLLFPALKVKLRFMILSTVYQRKRILKKNDLMTNESKLWARKRYLDEHGENYNFLLISEDKFVKRLGVTTRGLVLKYPITSQGISNLEKESYLKTGINLMLDQSERDAVL